jgi:hypothetical protein
VRCRRARSSRRVWARDGRADGAGRRRGGVRRDVRRGAAAGRQRGEGRVRWGGVDCTAGVLRPAVPSRQRRGRVGCGRVGVGEGGGTAG